MGFSARQLKALKRQPDARHIRTREANGRELTYLEGWYVVSEANRIFGFDGWSRETTESRCALARENKGTFVAVYVARVRLTVQANGLTIIREGHGTGEGRGSSPGEVHDIALKAAETDATKRALATFGKPFGLELYRGGKAGSQHQHPHHQQRPLPSPSLSPASPASPSLASTSLSPASPSLSASPPAAAAAVPGERLGLHPDDTTPIPRPSHYYGHRRENPIAQHFRDERRQAERSLATSQQQQQPAVPQPAAPPLAPDTPAGADAEPNPAARGRIDKSVLAIPEPKRLRDKAHLGFVASQPCLVCGRQPSDPHHLRFAQPRALGLKVSDEFTVPLCRGHHRELHQAGNEVAWWEKLKVKPLDAAKQLWGQTHPKLAVEQGQGVTATEN